MPSRPLRPDAGLMTLRSLALVALLAASVSCAGCPGEPTPVTFRVTNSLAWPIYVADESLQLGTAVQRREGDGTLTELREVAACACEECDSACGRCSCFGLPGIVRRIDPGQSFERTWQGEFRESTTTRCGLEQTPCLDGRTAAAPGSYRVTLCYAQSITGAPLEKNRFASDLPPGNLTCTPTDFELPAEAVVELVTRPPSPCAETSDCPEGQLCQGGRCSADCLPHEVPALGGEWTVEVGGLDDFGFFTVTAGDAGVKTYRGTGTLTSVQYSRGTTRLELERLGGELDYAARLYYVLPAGRALPLTVGETLEVTVVLHRDDGPRKLGRGLTLRRDGALVLAVDTGWGGRVLTAAQTAPLDVDIEGAPFACQPGDCGRRTHRQMRFSADGQSLTLEPGKGGALKAGGATWEVLAVGNHTDAVPECGPGSVAPYVMLVQSAAP